MVALDGSGVRVLVVGTGSHVAGSRLPDVSAVAATVRALEDCFRSVCRVPAGNLAVLLDPSGPEELLDAVLVAAQSASDVLVLYYVGHGVLDVTGELHLATRATVDMARKARFQALAYSEIVRALADCRARHVLVVLDCCFSARASVPVRSGALLSSADRDEQALAPEGEEYTAFSGLLVRALREGVPTAPTKLTVSVLHEHLTRALTARGRPAPILQTGGVVRGLVVAPNAADRSTAGVPPGVIDEAVAFDTDCPYRGLDSFTAADHALFHGRGSVVDRVLDRLRVQVHGGGLTLVTGPSGCGKSSLLQAGVGPAIGHGDLGTPGSAAWPLVSLVPGTDPLGALADQLAVLDPTTTREAARTALATGGGHALVASAVRASLPNAAEDGRLVIVVDQFEELFDPEIPDLDRALFVTVLDGLTRRSPSGADSVAVVVVGLRSDFGGECARFPELVAAAETSQVLVGPMTTAELRSAVSEPARLTGTSLEPGLVDLLLRDTGADPGDDSSAVYDPGALPLLSHTLLTVWQHRSGTTMTVAAYQAIGGVVGAVATTGEAVYCTLPEPQQDAARALMLRLVRVGVDAPDTRRRVTRTDLLDSAADLVSAAAALDAFTDARLITVDDGAVQLTHEALIKAWPRLRDWIAVDREDRLVAQEVEADAAQWRVNGNDAALLYRGSRLARAQARHLDLTRTSREFLSASSQAERRATRRLRQTVALLSVLLVSAVAAGSVAVVQGRNATAQLATATARQLLAQADTVLESDPATALRLGIAARRFDDTVETKSWLDSAVGNAAFAGRITEPADDLLLSGPSSVALTPDGRLLAVGHTTSTPGRSDQIGLWDLTGPSGARQVGGPIDLPGRAATIMFSADGRRLMSATPEGGIATWDVSDPAGPQPRGEPTPGAEPGTSGDGAVTFSADRTLLATGSTQGIQLWNLTGPAPVRVGAPLPGPADAVKALAFAPDARTLAVTSADFDRAVALWDITDPDRPALASQPLLAHTDSDVFRTAAFSPDGRTLVLGGSNFGVSLWDVTDRGHPHPVGNRITASGFFGRVAFRPETGELITYGSTRGSAYVWDVSRPGTPFLIRSLPAAGGLDLTFTADGALMALGSPLGLRQTELWRFDGHGSPKPAIVATTGHIENLHVARFSPDGTMLATGGKDRTVRLWDVRDPHRPRPIGQPLTGHVEAVTALAFSPDGRTLAVGSSSAQAGGVILWNVTDSAAPAMTGPPITDTGRGGWRALAFSADGTILAVGGYPPTFFDVHDLAHPQRIADIPEAQALEFTVSTDHRELATLGGGGGREVSLLDVTDPRSTKPIGGPIDNTDRTVSYDAVVRATLSASGQRLVVANPSVAYVWDLTDPQRPVRLGRPIEAHGGSGFDVALDPAATLLATAGVDGALLLWTLEDPGRPRAVTTSLEYHRDAIDDVTFSPNGTTVATTGNDGSLVLWDLDPLRHMLADSAAEACRVAGPLDPQEWSRYLPDRPYNDTCAV